MDDPYTNAQAIQILQALQVPENLGDGYSARIIKNMVNRISSMSDSIKRVVLAHRQDQIRQAQHAAQVAAAVAAIPAPAPIQVPATITADDAIQWLRQAAVADRVNVYQSIFGQCEYKLTIDFN